MTANSVIVVSGSIRTPDDTDALSVKLSIWETEITMRVDGAELGNWELSEVSVRPIDDTSFEFIAEGDQLIFTPDDPVKFGASSLMRGATGGRRRGRKAKQRGTSKSGGDDLAAAHSGAGADGGRVERRAPAPPQAPKPSRRERKAAERAAAEQAALERAAAEQAALERAAAEQAALERAAAEQAAKEEAASTAASERAAHVRAEPVPRPIGTATDSTIADSTVVDGILTTDAPPRVAAATREPQAEPVAVPARKRRRAKSRRESPPQEEDESPDDSPELPNRMWIRALDLARKYDFLGLDRVPINESLRGQEHQHTWDHRVAPPSGAGARICTICGEFRR